MNSIYSMTGYASLKKATEQGLLSLDIKSLNSRYFEFYFKAPDSLKYLEPIIREKIKKICNRGKIECIVAFEVNNSDLSSLNEELIDSLINKINEINSKVKNGYINTASILTFPGVLESKNKHIEEIGNAIINEFDTLLSNFNESRRREGENLKVAILNKVDNIALKLVKIKELLSTLTEDQRKKIKERLENIKNLVSIDEARLEQEVVLLAQKYDIAEEYDRLMSHIKETKVLLEKGGIIGKRLDFMMQEYNRESNTMASKSSNIEVTKIAVDLKVLIEQMREQVQNIE